MNIYENRIIVFTVIYRILYLIIYVTKAIARRIIGEIYYRKSYAQEGEDMILIRNIINKKSGFYVDIGAHHPQRFSNTYMFYLMGWRGINIDATPGSMAIFDRIRPRDINLEIAISSERKYTKFFIFNEPALNTFDINTRNDHISHGYSVVKEIEIRTELLSDVLRRYTPENIEIDILSIDVEGFDLKVLQSNDWSLFRPIYILVEIILLDLRLVFDSDVYKLLSSNGYVIFAKTGYTLIFKRAN